MKDTNRTSALKLTAVALTAVALMGCATTKNTVNDLLGRDQGFNRLDRNGDGVLSRSEADELPSLADDYERIDTNNDSNINRNEFRAANVRIADQGFNTLDLNGDGVISQREAEASRPSLRETFAQVDADQDGNVSDSEYRAATHNLLQKVKFEQADIDGDGVLDRKEVEGHALVNAQFDALDVNNDSLVGPDEFGWAQRN